MHTIYIYVICCFSQWKVNWSIYSHNKRYCPRPSFGARTRSISISHGRAESSSSGRIPQKRIFLCPTTAVWPRPRSFFSSTPRQLSRVQRRHWGVGVCPGATSVLEGTVLEGGWATVLLFGPLLSLVSGGWGSFPICGSTSDVNNSTRASSFEQKGHDRQWYDDYEQRCFHSLASTTITIVK